MPACILVLLFRGLVLVVVKTIALQRLDVERVWVQATSVDGAAVLRWFLLFCERRLNTLLQEH